MHRSRFLASTLTTVLVLGGLVTTAQAMPAPTRPSPAVAAPTQAAAVPGFEAHDRTVSDVPASWTPRILDGRTYAITQVGSTMVVGGDFSQVSPSSGSPVMPRANVFAFNATNGQINSGFAPIPEGEVRAVEPGPTAGTVYVGGAFKGINGVSGKVLLLDVTNGSIISSFKVPAMNGAVQDLVRIGNRLYVGGVFTKVGGQPHGGLVTLNATTGARESFLAVSLTEHHNYTGAIGQAQAPVGAKAIAVNPTATQMSVVGNFRKADGLDRDQMVMIDLTGASAKVRSDWRTRRYEATCASRAFDTYMRDVSFAPDGSYVNVATTGGPFSGTLCDTVTRWDVANAGLALEPDWTDVSGGDTFLSVAASGAAVYAGGHQRWMNNPLGRDSAGAGAVARPGLGAMDPDNGVPVSWNPGRHPRGVGAEAIDVTQAGVWVGSDTEFIGNRQYRRPRLAFFPVTGGIQQGPGATGDLPGNVYRGNSLGALSRLYYEGGAAKGQPQPAPAGDIAWANVRGAVVIDNELFYATSDGQFIRRTFDGERYGPANAVDPYNDPKWMNVATGSGTSFYRGLKPSFYSEIPGVAGMAYQNDQLYYTRSGSSALYRRAFVPESGVMSQVVTQVPGFSALNVGGIFFNPAGDALYFANSVTGTLSRIGWDNGAVVGVARVVSGPLVDGVDWRSRALFLAAGPEPVVNQAQVTDEAVVASDPPLLVGQDATNEQSLEPQVVVPAEVQSGDVLLLFVTAAAADELQGPSGVSGWTDEGQVTSGPLAVSVFSHVAEDADAGQDVTMTLPRYFKTDLTLVAYRGVGADPVEIIESAVASRATEHTTPVVAVPGSGRTVLSFWADRSSTTTKWTAPAGLSVISTQIGVGGGRVTSLLGAAESEAGEYGGLTAQTDQESARSAAMTVVLAP